jgi:hypothetical protein
MSDYQTDVLDHLARVIGGTVSGVDPHFFSGAIALDQSGIAGLTGCYSAAPADIGVPPVGILLPGRFEARLRAQGDEDNVEEVRLLILVATSDIESQAALLAPYRDLVPAAFRANMRAFAMPNNGYCFVSAGSTGVHEWAGQEYFAWEFTLTVQRDIPVVYIDGPAS